MECKICLKSYSRSNIPYALSCGHTLCKICLLRIGNSICPFDRSRISRSNPNFQLIHILGLHLEEISEEKPGELFCKSYHLLSVELNSEMLLIQCNECLKFTRKSTWHCSFCNYDKCHDCNNDILCFNNHIMHKTHRNPFKCDGCLNQFDQESMHCKECDSDLCNLCCMHLENKVPSEKICRRGHQIKWKDDLIKTCEIVYGKKYYACNVCRRKFNKVGGFYCLECGLNTCITCH